jgi:hypothetical protein
MEKPIKTLNEVLSRSNVYDSLILLCAIRISHFLNTNQFGKDSDSVVKVLATRFPEECIQHLYPYLHHRWISKLVSYNPNLKASSRNYIGSSLRIEEDFWRTQEDNDAGLINVFEEKDTFKYSDFPASRICFYSTPPIHVKDGQIQLRKDEYTKTYNSLCIMNTQLQSSSYYAEKVEGQNSIVEQREFKIAFEEFTENQLQKLNWNNLFVAGGKDSVSVEVLDRRTGSVSACILPRLTADISYRESYFHHYLCQTSDIDIFIYGLSPEESYQKVVPYILQKPN